MIFPAKFTRNTKGFVFSATVADQAQLVNSVMEVLGMPKQNFNAGSGTNGPHRQGEKGGKGGTIKKQGRSMDPGETGDNAGLGRSDSEKERVGRAHKTRP